MNKVDRILRVFNKIHVKLQRAIQELHEEHIDHLVAVADSQAKAEAVKKEKERAMAVASKVAEFLK